MVRYVVPTFTTASFVAIRPLKVLLRDCRENVAEELLPLCVAPAVATLVDGDFVADRLAEES